jgi:L-lactate dehydrogenase complex protein LldG
MIGQFTESLKRNSVEILDDTEEEIKKTENVHISEALSAAADTGIIFLGGFDEARKSGLAEHHIVIVRKNAICETTIEAYRLAISKSDYVFASTSASKTADIEGKLIWGMHGPRKFSVVIK